MIFKHQPETWSVDPHDDTTPTRRATCLFCQHVVESCRSKARFIEWQMDHRAECFPDNQIRGKCESPNCMDCHHPLVTVIVDAV